MSDQRFRQAYDALMERMPDPPSFEAIASTPVTTDPRGGWRGNAIVLAASLVAVLGFVGLALLVAPDDPGSGTTPVGSVECLAPPESAQTLPDSDFTLTVTPNPVSPGGQAELVIGNAGAPSGDTITGAVAMLQCWDGTTWVDTHWLFKDGLGSGPVEVEPDVTITFPAVGLLIDEPHTVVMPDLAPGLYRIEDQIQGSVNTTVYALVQVDEDAPSITTVSTTEPLPDSAGAELWTAAGVGMSFGYVASSGEIVLANNDLVFVADGFDGDLGSKVSAFDAETGGLVWQRDDLTMTTTLATTPFLQLLIGDVLLVNGQYDIVTAVDASSGDTLWEFSLPEGYGAVRSTESDGVVVVGTEAPAEGDARSPIVYALDLADGAKLWETHLAEGTDLQWHAPPIGGGLVFVSSTLSHPDSAPGNMIHAIDLSSGAVRWVADLGGDQVFNFWPALVSGESLVTWTPDGSAIALRITDGSQVWDRPDAIPMAVDQAGMIYARRDGIVKMDPSDGTVTPFIEPSDLGLDTVQTIVIQEDQLVLTGLFGARGFDLTNGEPTWRIVTPQEVALPAVTSTIIVKALDSRVAVYEIPQD